MTVHGFIAGCTVSLLLFAGPLSGCKGVAQRAQGEVEVAIGARLQLLHPRTFGSAVALEQLVEARHGEDLHTLHAMVEIDAERFVMVGLTPFGSRAFTLTFDGVTFTVENLTPRDVPFDPAFMLADIQMTLWPSPPLVPGLVWREEPGPGGGVRTLLRGDTEVVKIHYATYPYERPMTLEHLERGYSLKIATVHAERLAGDAEPPRKPPR
ncbi:MAG: DUF3261 domain-containing protein [Planctomycetota bacterium]|jgi:hypothetical protein